MDFATVLSVAQTLFSTLQCKELNELCSLFNYKSKLKDLQHTVATIQAVLRDAETKQELSEQELLYIEDLKDAVYEADDLFDEFVTLAEKKKLNGDSKVRFFSVFNTVGVAYKMSQGVKDIKKKLDAISSNHSQFSLKLDHDPIRKRRPETCSYVYAKNIVGREDDVKKIVGILLDSSAKTKVSFLSVVGIGGLGKTTLAQLVYNDQRIRNAFPLRLWICVADEGHKPFDTQVILSSILSSVAKTTKVKYDFSTIDLVQSQLLAELAKGQYFLVLDDVWTEIRDEWVKLEEYLLGGQRGGWVVVTTRSSGTARIVGEGEMYELKGLSEENSWRLFKEVAFVSKQSNPPDDFVNIGQQIVKRCVGVPLAIRVAGSALYGQAKSKWLLFQEIGLAKIKESREGTLPILKLSYDNLESSLKSCFSYCALFPKDYEIPKDRLVRLWMAQGYVVPIEKGQSIEDAAHEYFTILLRRCFFQDVKRCEYNGEIYSCKIHDLMHDIAQEVSEKEICAVSSNTAEVDGRVRHLSLGDGSIDNLSLKAQLRTFLLFRGGWVIGQQLVKELLANCVCLRTLDLSHLSITSLPDVIGKLLHLRYLNLSGNRCLQVLPETVTELHNLEVLSLQKCSSLKKLPETLGKLVKLRVLDIDQCSVLRKVPLCVGKLTQLQMLTRFSVGLAQSSTTRQFHNELEILQALNNIRGFIEIIIRVPENAKYIRKDDEGGVYLRRKEYLEHIVIVFNEDTNMEYEEALLDELQPHDNLKNLELELYNGERMPNWAKQDNLSIFLPNLVRLRLGYCSNLRCLSLTGKLRHLKYLIIENLDKLEYVESDNNPVLDTGSSGDELSLFPCLEEVRLCTLPKFTGWWGTSSDGVGGKQSRVSLPSALALLKLKKLEIIGCPEMTSFPWCSLVKDHLIALKILSISGSPKIQLNEEDGGIPWQSLSHNLRTLKLWDFPQLVNLPTGMQCLTSLSYLNIGNCKGLESLPDWMPNLISLRQFYIQNCPTGLYERCQRPHGEDWSKIQHIPSSGITKER